MKVTISLKRLKELEAIEAKTKEPLSKRISDNIKELKAELLHIKCNAQLVQERMSEINEEKKTIYKQIKDNKKIIKKLQTWTTLNNNIITGQKADIFDMLSDIAINQLYVIEAHQSSGLHDTIGGSMVISYDPQNPRIKKTVEKIREYNTK